MTQTNPQDQRTPNDATAVQAGEASLKARIEFLESELAAANARLNGVLEAIGTFDLDLVVVDCKGRLIAKRGLADLALEDGGASDKVGKAVHSAFDRMLSSGNREDEIVASVGPPRRTIAVNVFPLCDTNQTLIGGIAAIHDVTEGDVWDSGLRDFVANLSHELKTPIGALGLLAETLLLEHNEEITHRLIRRMHSEAVRVGSVIDDLLNMSRIDASNTKTFEVHPARQIVERAVARVEYTAEHRHIDIGVSGDIGATIYGDDGELVSAVHHLIENSLKYSPENSSIEISVRTDGSWTEVAVQDHGVGIAPQYLDRIFERFYRVDNARTRTHGGTGLGLAIVRRVVHNHGGEVLVKSEEGKGSTFTLRLASRPSQNVETQVGDVNG